MKSPHDIIIRPVIQPLNHIHLCGLGGHHNDGETLRGRVLPELANNIIAAFIRQHHI